MQRRSAEAPVMYSEGLRWGHRQCLECTGHAAAAPGILLWKRASPQRCEVSKGRSWWAGALEREAPLSLSDVPETIPELPVEEDALLFFAREITELPPVLCSCSRRLWTLNPPTTAFLHWGFSGCREMPRPGGARCSSCWQMGCRRLTCNFEKHLNTLCLLVTSRLWCVRVAGYRNLTVNAILYFSYICYCLPCKQLN